MKKFTYLMSVFTLAFSIVVAAKASENFSEPAIEDEYFLSEKQYTKLIKEAKTKKSLVRSLAHTDRVDYATAFTEDFKNLSSELIGGNVWKGNKMTDKKVVGVKSSEDLAQVISKYAKKDNYSKLSYQSQWVAAQLSALKPWRGFLTRIRPLIEDSDAPFVHSFLVTWVRAANAGINAFAPTEQWEAGFDYMAKPYVGMPALIKTDLDLYKFVRDEVLPSMKQLSARMRMIAYVKKGNNSYQYNPEFKPFYFDNKLLYSTMKIVDEQDRYVQIGRAELHSYISNVNLSVSSAYSALAYNWDGLLKTINKIANTYGFNSFFSSDPGKMTAEKRIKAIRKSDDLFTLLPKSGGLKDGGATWTKASYPWFKAGVRQGRIAWMFSKKSADSDTGRYSLLDPRALQPFSRVIDTSFDNMATLIEGEGARSTMIDGEELEVNFKKLFFAPPKDLKKFLAVKFEGGSKDLVESKTKMKYRNYKLGNPKSWDLNQYRVYFPNVDQDSVPKAIRVLSQTWGANILGMAMAPVLF